jgi:hypothetical protein
MTIHTALRARACSERGSAIVGVLLLLMIMTALGAALSVSGQTETFVARNHQTHAQALVAAEAGLNHAAQVFIDHIKLLDPVAVNAELDALLADPTLLEPEIDLDSVINIAGSTEAVSYRASLMDEDDPDRGAAASDLTDDGDATNDEDGAELTDNNQKVLIRSTGFGPNGAVVTLEAILAPYEYGALVTEGDLELSGSVTITGTGASVHSNGDLDVGGAAASLGSITASGSYTGSFPGTSGAPEVPLPNVDPGDYRHHADFILKSDGTMTNPAGNVLCTWSSSSSCNSWHWDGGSQTWTVKSGTSTATNGTYYVEGNATVAGNPGSPASPWAVTIIATKSINISGSPDMVAHTDELLFVAGGDLEISGGLGIDPLVTQGQILVHEQLKVSGNPTISGQIIVEDAVDAEPLVHTNQVSGNLTLVYNGGLGSNLFSVTGWREVK